jgi:hypothetical protein
MLPLYFVCIGNPENVGRLYFITVGLCDIHLNLKFDIELYAIIFLGLFL